VIIVLALLAYAFCAGWCVPALLVPLTRRGISVRAGLAAWLTAMASALVAVAVAAQFAFRTVAADWPQLTRAVCRSVAGSACTPEVYGSVLYQAGVIVLAASLALAGVLATWRYTSRVHRSTAQTRSHAQAALLVGHAIAAPGIWAAAASAPGLGAASSADPAGAAPAAGDPAARSGEPAGAGAGRARTVMLDDPRPAAYCVAGRPAAIVVTSGALAVLDPPQLAAVLAHEGAHLTHRHHTLATITRGLAAALPGVPLFTRGAAEVATLTEMAADDAAARTAGRPPLIAALIAIATGAAFPSAGVANAGVANTKGSNAGASGLAGAGVPRGAMAAAAGAVPDRVERLLSPSSTARAAAFAATLTLVLTLLAAAPLALTALLAG
jgi:Zn-dependent protease with chaperone function